MGLPGVENVYGRRVGTFGPRPWTFEPTTRRTAHADNNFPGFAPVWGRSLATISWSESKPAARAERYSLTGYGSKSLSVCHIVSITIANLRPTAILARP